MVRAASPQLSSGTEGIRALFEAYKDKVYSIALRYSGDSAAAMDIAQDTFVKLLSGADDGFRGEAHFESWLYRVVVNACLDYHRRSRRWATLIEGVTDAIRPVRETALGDILRAEARDEVREMVAKLPPEQRIVVILRYTEALSYEEIAEAAGCSMGTVASRLNRAHKTLERRLGHLRGREV